MMYANPVFLKCDLTYSVASLSVTGPESDGPEQQQPRGDSAASHSCPEDQVPPCLGQAICGIRPQWILCTRSHSDDISFLSVATCCGLRVHNSEHVKVTEEKRKRKMSLIIMYSCFLTATAALNVLGLVS